MGSSRPILSTVVRVHRRPTKLARALASLERQTMKDFEVVCTIDDPTDTLSLEVLKDFQARIPLRQVSVSYKGWPGCNDYLNTAVQYCEGEWVTYLDDDDEVLSPDYYGELRKAFEKGPDVVLTKFLQGVRVGEYQVLPSQSSWGIEPKRCDIGTPCVTVRKALAEKYRWEPTPTGDFDFIVRVAREAASLDRLIWLPVVAVRTQGKPSFGATEY